MENKKFEKDKKEKAYKVQIVKHLIINRTVGACDEDEAEAIAYERFRDFDFSGSASEITCDVIGEGELFDCERDSSSLRSSE